MNSPDLFDVVALHPELMKDLLNCICDMSPEQRADYSKRVFALIELIEDLPAPDPAMDCASILIAFEFRLEALLRLREMPEYHYWALQTGKGSEPDCIDEVLIEVAAGQPLIQSNHLPTFEPAAFFAKALELSKVAGRA